MARRAALLVALAATAALLAGCSSGPAKPAAAPDTDFTDLDLAATSTTGLVRGIVVDQAIRPVAAATVTLTPGGRAAQTTAEGTFGFDGLEPGTYFLHASKTGYNATQTATDVVAGVAEPPVVKVLMAQNPATTPYVEALTFNGFLSLGAAVVATSIGTTILPQTAQALGDASIWTVTYSVLPLWAQGELVWEQNQPAGGELIWEMTDTSNTHYGYRETTVSPALAYWNTTTLAEHNETTLDPGQGIAYRFFGGPHPLCTTPPPAPNNFGCGLTFQQRADAYIHSFYNFVPPEGWRFTKDGQPQVPQ
jgi:hypothetical protein